LALPGRRGGGISIQHAVDSIFWAPVPASGGRPQFRAFSPKLGQAYFRDGPCLFLGKRRRSLFLIVTLCYRGFLTVNSEGSLYFFFWRFRRPLVTLLFLLVWGQAPILRDSEDLYKGVIFFRAGRVFLDWQVVFRVHF